ncbi:MAG: oligosaccharide flippase family protein [Nitrososphaerota archaeon]|nr:oligosaccharide flippase family protein [Nitrososphaerota archaeon]
MKEADKGSVSGGETTDRIRNISRGLGSLAVQNVLTSGLAFVFLAVLLRLVSYGDYNAYSSVLVSVGIAVTASTFGLQYSAARFFAYYRDDETRAWGAAKSVLILSSIFTAAATLIFEILAKPLSIYFTNNTQFTLLFQLGGIWLFTYSISSVLQGIIQGMKKYTTLAKMLVVSRMLMVAFTLVALEITHSADFAVLAWVIYYVIVNLWTLKIVWRKLLRRSDFSHYSMIMRYSAPLGIAGILAVVSTSGDSVILGGYTQSLGVYNAAITISSVLSFVFVTPVITTLLPEASWSSKIEGEVSNGARLAIRFSVLGLFPVSLFVAAVSNQLLSLFSGGGNYLLGVESLQFISITFIFVGIQGIAYSILQALGKTVQALIAGAIASVADISLSLFLVPRFGIMGATISKVAVVVIGMSVAMYFIRMHLHNLDSCIFYLKSAVAALVPFAIILALSSVLTKRIILLGPYLIIWSILFFACVRTLKIITEEDRRLIAHMIPTPLQRILRYF